MKLMIFATLLTAALAAPQNFYRQPTSSFQQPQYQEPGYSRQAVVPIVSESNELNPDGSFSYSYVSGDGAQQQAQGYLKNAGQKDNEVEVIQGSYSYTAPDGTPITVNWVADENGFRAEGAHIPTPPPIPAEIQKSLDLIARQPIQPQNQYPAQYRQPATPSQTSFPSQRRFRY